MAGKPSQHQGKEIKRGNLYIVSCLYSKGEQGDTETGQ